MTESMQAMTPVDEQHVGAGNARATRAEVRDFPPRARPGELHHARPSREACHRHRRLRPPREGLRLLSASPPRIRAQRTLGTKNGRQDPCRPLDRGRYETVSDHLGRKRVTSGQIAFVHGMRQWVTAALSSMGNMAEHLMAITAPLQRGLAKQTRIRRPRHCQGGASNNNSSCSMSTSPFDVIKHSQTATRRDPKQHSARGC